MQPLDLVIRGGTVATATDSFKAKVGIRGGKIAAIAEGLLKYENRTVSWVAPKQPRRTASHEVANCFPPK